VIINDKKKKMNLQLVLILVILSNVTYLALAQNAYLIPNGFQISNNCTKYNCTTSTCCVRSGNDTITSYCVPSGSVICCGCSDYSQVSTCSGCPSVNFCGPEYECVSIIGVTIPGILIMIVLLAYFSIQIWETCRDN